MSDKQKNQNTDKTDPIKVAVPKLVRERCAYLRERLIRLQIEHDTAIKTVLETNNCTLPVSAFQFADQTMEELVQVKFPE